MNATNEETKQGILQKLREEGHPLHYEVLWRGLGSPQIGFDEALNALRREKMIYRMPVPKPLWSNMGIQTGYALIGGFDKPTPVGQ